MNISAKLKASQQPSYIFNFNIDIPIKYKSSMTHRSNPVSPGKSPGKLTQKRYKLSSITPRPSGVSANVTNTKKSEKSSIKSNKKTQKIPKTMKEQFLQKDLHQLNNFLFTSQQKKPQASISRKTQRMVSNKKSSQHQEICPSRRTVKPPHTINTSSNNQITTHTNKSNVVRNISILEKLVTDNNIKYKTDSSDARHTENSSIAKHDNFMAKLTVQQQQFKLQKQQQTQSIIAFIESGNEDFDLTEIREFEEISTQRKEKLHYEYLKEKILIEASVRKIQRAWRNYRTKKLVTSYSSPISFKFMKNQLINTARSQTRGLNISKYKKPFNSNELYVGKQQQIIKMPERNIYIQNNQSSSNDSQDQQESSKQLEKEELKPFTKKTAFTTGKIEGKFFDNQKIINNVSPRPLLTRPASAKEKHIQAKVEQMIFRQSEKTPQNNSKQLKSQERMHERQQQMEQKLKKFQEQQIRKWESILDSIKKGKNIEVLLQKSERYKRQLQNNLKQQINLAAINQNRASPILFKSKSSKSSLGGSMNVSLLKKEMQAKKQDILQEKKKQDCLSPQLFSSDSISHTSQKHQADQHNETAQKRRERIMFFQNQILKIDNQEFSDMSSVSCQSFTKLYPKNTQDDDLEQREKEENMKLRKKLQLFNTHFLDISSAEEGLTDRSLKGLKGNSTDERRNNISKRLTQNNQLGVQITQNTSEKEELSSEQGRKNRRPDMKIIANQSNTQKPVSKIQELINRKIQYPEEESSSAQSSLGVEHSELSPIIRQNSNQLSESSSNEEILRFDDNQKYLDPQQLYGDPAMRSKDRKLQVPGLKLENIPKKFPNKSQQKLTSLRQKLQTLQSTEDFFVTNKKQQDDSSKLDSKKDAKEEKPIPKISMEKTLKICSLLEEQLIYQELLQFSDSNRIVENIKGLFDSFKKQKKKPKPQGICTNLESIKDYLQNFVGFIFQNNMTAQIQNCLWTPSGPSSSDFLRYLRKDSEYSSDQSDYIMNIEIFQKHWKYANSNIYFDRKYNDEQTELERVSYLKGLTRVYFRSIYDAFNQSLQFQRVHGLTGRPYPWSKKISKYQKNTLKVAFQQGYRRILKISVVYYGVHFDDKSHLFDQDDIKELQQERLLTLLTMEMADEEYRWNFLEDELSEVRYDAALMIEQLVLEEFLAELLQVQAARVQ